MGKEGLRSIHSTRPFGDRIASQPCSSPLILRPRPVPLAPQISHRAAANRRVTQEPLPPAASAGSLASRSRAERQRECLPPRKKKGRALGDHGPDRASQRVSKSKKEERVVLEIVTTGNFLCASRQQGLALGSL